MTLDIQSEEELAAAVEAVEAVRARKAGREPEFQFSGRPDIWCCPRCGFKADMRFSFTHQCWVPICPDLDKIGG